MVVSVAVLACLAFIGWLIARAVRRKAVNAHTVSYAIAVVAGIFTFAFFLAMDIPQLIKVVISILLGVALLFLAGYLQRRRQVRG